MADFSLLRLHPNDERELRWFFQQSEGALGLRSGHESLVNACLGGRNKGSKPVGAARQFQVAQRACICRQRTGCGGEVPVAHPR